MGGGGGTRQGSIQTIKLYLPTVSTAAHTYAYITEYPPPPPLGAISYNTKTQIHFVF